MKKEYVGIEFEITLLYSNESIMTASGVNFFDQDLGEIGELDDDGGIG